MMRFATAVMWIEHEVLGVTEDLILVSSHKKRGKLLLEDVLEVGNFGKSCKRQVYRKKDGFINGGIVMS